MTDKSIVYQVTCNHCAKFWLADKPNLRIALDGSEHLCDPWMDEIQRYVESLDPKLSDEDRRSKIHEFDQELDAKLDRKILPAKEAMDRALPYKLQNIREMMTELDARLEFLTSTMAHILDLKECLDEEVQNLIYMHRKI